VILRSGAPDRMLIIATRRLYEPPGFEETRVGMKLEL
jgi:hypothetical protein